MLQTALAAQFKRPGVRYRGISFWSLNGRLESRELKRQIDYFKKMGLGAVCLHARSGLQTRYLSKQWFKLMRECVEHAKDRKMLVWLYDEDRYPSGFAGGFVTKNPEFRQKRMRLDFLSEGQPVSNDTVATFAFSGTQEKPATFRRIQSLSEMKAGEFAAAFRVLQAPLNPWYNGYTYLDAMHPRAVRQFIQTTYEPYKRLMGQHFGKTIEAIFTDEPTYGQSLMSFWGDFIDGYKEAEQREIPWSVKLEKRFKDRFGYDLLDHLPELYIDFGDHTEVTRHDYYEMITSQLNSSFASQIYRWCDKAGIDFAGHVLFEETCSTQTSAVGSAMRFYEHFHIPGIDILTDAAPDYDTAIQCASAARQFGRKWVLSETYGVTGWDFPLEGHKAVGDWQAALGVNKRCLHLSFYTMSGAAKRDCPASISFQSAYADHYKPIEDYFGRVNLMLTQGKFKCRLLVIHPVESTWIRWRLKAKEQTDIKKLDQRLIDLRNWLLQAQLPFDYADEHLLCEHGSVRGSQLCVGKGRYDAVLVPQMLTIRGSTCDVLRKFAAAGGRVIFAGRPSQLVDAEESSRAFELADQCLRIDLKEKAVVQATRDLAFLQLSAGKQVLSHVREKNGQTIAFLCNTSRKKAIAKLNVQIKSKGDVQEWDLMTAERFSVRATKGSGNVSFDTDLPPSGSRLFVVSSQKADLPTRPNWRDVRKVSLPATDWQLTLREPNPLVLDFVRVRIGGTNWSVSMECLKADRWIREQIGYKPHSYFELQPWKQPRTNGRPHRVETESVFNIDRIPAGEIHIAFERIAGLKSAAVNNQPISLAKPNGYWVDPCFVKYRVDPSWLHSGENSLRFEIDYVERSGLENAFLLSSGRVLPDLKACTLRKAEPTIRIGDAAKQGLPFYGAGMVYSQPIRMKSRKGESVFLALPGWRGACVLIHLDGRQVGAIYSPPDEVLLPVADDKVHELGIEVILGRGNTFGPLHRKGKISAWAGGPFEWETEGERWQDEYRLAPTGLLAAPQIIYRRKTN